MVYFSIQALQGLIQSSLNLLCGNSPSTKCTSGNMPFMHTMTSELSFLIQIFPGITQSFSQRYSLCVQSAVNSLCLNNDNNTKSINKLFNLGTSQKSTSYTWQTLSRVYSIPACKEMYCRSSCKNTQEHPKILQSINFWHRKHDTFKLVPNIMVTL